MKNNSCSNNISVRTQITQKDINNTLNVLTSEGIEYDQAQIVLQAIGYTLLDTELDSLIWED